MPVLPARAQQPSPVPPQVELPPEFPDIPQDLLDRFPSAKGWQNKLDDFWTRTKQGIQSAQTQAANFANSRVVYSVDQFLIYAKGGIPEPMFALSSTGVKLGDVLTISTVGRKVFIGVGQYADDNTPFYIDTTGRFSLGANLTWDPETSTLTITGTINATTGTIGGFVIGTDYIRDVANSFGLASTVTGGDDVRFWSGDTFANRATAPFRVFESGLARALFLGATFIEIGGSNSFSGAVGLSIIGSYTVAGANNAYGISNFSVLNAIANGNSLGGIDVTCQFAKGAFTGLTAYGQHINLDSATGAGTIANAYGIYIEAVTIGTANYGIYSVGGNNVFLGGINSTAIGATTPSTGAFTTVSATGVVTAGGHLVRNAAAGTQRALAYQSAGVDRWWVYCSSSAESGGNAGSNFAILNFDDTGGVIGNALVINRATSAVTLAGALSAGAAVSFSATIASDVVLKIRNSDTGAASVGGIGFGNDSIAFGAYIGLGSAAGSEVLTLMNIRNAPLVLGTNNTQRLIIAAGGGVQIPSLAGVGTRTVVADTSGNLTAP